MNAAQTDGFAKLANLRNQLKTIEEVASLECENQELRQARENLVNKIQCFNYNRFELGRAISRYKVLFKAEGAWIKAASLIAESLVVSERTVHRLIQEYEFASELPAITLDVMQEQRIDPAAAKNMPVVETLLQMPEPTTRNEAVEQVHKVAAKHVAKKRAARKAAAKPSAASLEAFTKHIVKQFERRFSSMAPEQRDNEIKYVFETVVNTIRANVHELGQYSRPTLVPMPVLKAAA